MLRLEHLDAPLDGQPLIPELVPFFGVRFGLVVALLARLELLTVKL